MSLPPSIGVPRPDAAVDNLVIDLTHDERRRRFRSGADRVAVLVARTAASADIAEGHQLQQALDAVTDMVLVARTDGRLEFANRAARVHLDLADGTSTGTLVDLLVHGAGSGEIREAIATHDTWVGERTLANACGTFMHLAVSVTATPSSDGRTATWTIVAHDRSEHIALERALAHQLTHDALTGLANRQHLLLKLDRALSDVHGDGALLLIDIDEFRTVSNSLGHEAGNRLLMAFASRLTRAFPHGCLIARVGGDEFVVFCPGSHDLDALAAEVQDAVATPFSVDEQDIHLSVMVGIAAVDDHDRPRDGAELFRRADAAVYDAKARGRGRHGIFDAEVGAAATDRLTIAHELRRALRNHELEVHYQPKIDLETGTISGAEALIRWRLPDGTMRSPAMFLDVAEDTGLIIPIGRVVLEQACTAAARMQKQFPADATLGMAVNLSVRQLDHPDFVEELAQVVCASGVDPSRLELEITESMVMDDIEASTAMLLRLKQLGAHIAIDDFGTGHSSLKYLQRLPVDVLKIDRSFVSGLASDDADQTAIVTAVIHLAQALRLDTIAEGVETAAQLVELRSLGCNGAQGFFMSKPLPEAEFLALVAAGPVW